ncbi:PIN domain-containing protein [Candidimonas nitroreducens]|nr:PIN domain-containing protein [Candidimonas nitroreducens]
MSPARNPDMPRSQAQRGGTPREAARPAAISVPAPDTPSPDGAAAGAAPPAVLLLDTCVLISNVLRRLLLHLAAQGCLRPAWSRVIGEEWRRNAARLWDVPADEVAAQWQALQRDFPQADLGEVEAYKQGLRYSDPKDWHVVAAGRAALARWPGQPAAILTRNLKDFDRRELRGLGLQLYEPDRYLELCWAAHGGPLRDALESLAQELAQIEAAPPLHEVLGRERLYRLRKLWHGQGGQGGQGSHARQDEMRPKPPGAARPGEAQAQQKRTRSQS